MNEPHPAPEHRRQFLTKAAAVTAGSVVALCPVVAGVAVFIDPLTHPGTGAVRVDVTSLAALPDDGIPRLFQVIVDHRDDAWNRFHNEPIGAVFLRRMSGTETVEAFNAACPHAGCYVDFNGQRDEFQCPCHMSGFAIDGKFIYGPSPRGLDTLKCEVVDVKGQKQVFVEFEDFYTGIAEKKPKA